MLRAALARIRPGAADAPPAAAPAAARAAPKIAACGTDAAANKRLYDEWGDRYERDVRAWGYRMPEVCAAALKRHAPDGERASFRVLDAGAGDGLSGKAIVDEGFPHVVGIDISPELVAKASARGVYRYAEVGNLAEPLKYDSGEFDAVMAVGVMTYLEPTGTCLDELCRVVKDRGLVIFTHRTDKMSQWEEKHSQLERDRVWEKVEISEPQPYLPKNPEFADEIKVVVHVYRVTKTSVLGALASRMGCTCVAR